MSENEITKDQSKSDALLKESTLLHVSWPIIQLIARHVRRLPITEVELATVKYQPPNESEFRQGQRRGERRKRYSSSAKSIRYSNW